MHLTKSPWCLAAEAALADTFADVSARQIARFVDTGTCELWNVNYDESWLVTGIEKENGERILFLWCYAGRNARAMAEALQAIARRNGISRIQFVTFHKGLPRLLSNVAPRTVAVTEKGARLYEFGA